MERMPIWQIALRRLEMPVPRFLSLYVAPIVAVTFFIAIAIVVLTGGSVSYTHLTLPTN